MSGKWWVIAKKLTPLMLGRVVEGSVLSILSHVLVSYCTHVQSCAVQEFLPSCQYIVDYRGYNTAFRKCRCLIPYDAFKKLVVIILTFLQWLDLMCTSPG